MLAMTAHPMVFAGLAWALVVAVVSCEAVRRCVGRASKGGSLKPALRYSVFAAQALARLPVLLIRPCAGDEPYLERALASLTATRFSRSLRCRLAVADVADPALPSMQHACATLEARGIDARIVVTDARGPNRKAAQLAAVVAQEIEAYESVVVADSDVDLSGVDLDRLTAALDVSPVQVVWAPPVEVSVPRTWGDRASTALLGGSLHAFPLLAGLDAGGLVGKLFAISAEALDGIGGFASLTAHLGEDMEIARRIRARGGAVRIAPFVARCCPSGRSLEAIVARYARWISVLRVQRPWLLASYPALFFATPLLLALCALAAPAVPAVAALAAVVTLAARVFVAVAAERAAGRPPTIARVLLDLCLADALLCISFFRALSSRTVVWRDAVLTVDRAGQLREEAA